MKLVNQRDILMHNNPNLTIKFSTIAKICYLRFRLCEKIEEVFHQNYLTKLDVFYELGN